MNNIGLFIASYEITTGLIGAPTLRLDLVVSTPNQMVSGHANVSNASILPAFSKDSRVHGEFTYMTVMPNITHILVTATGDAITSPTQPIEIPNLRLRMVLEADWSKGTANFDYVNANGEWSSVTNAAVKKVNSNTTAPVASIPSEAQVAQN